MQYRIIKSETNTKEIKIDIQELGYSLYFTLTPEVAISTDVKDDNDNPIFDTQINYNFLRLEKHKNHKNLEEVKTHLKDISIIPPDLLYDHAFLGFVYANESDPNNHRWWIDFRDNKDQSIYNYYSDDIIINCPITTTKWHDEDPNGIWHGRFVFSKSELETIMEPKTGKLIVNGKLRTECKPLNLKNICSPQSIPKGGESLRLRYNVREDIWFCDILDKKDKELGSIPCKSVICDAKMYGQIVMVGNKPRVSTRININDISEVGIAINSLIIRGK